MKTKGRALAVLATLAIATPFFGAMASTTPKAHKIVLKNLTLDSINTTAKTITAHSGTGIAIQIVQSTDYTLGYSKKTRFVRASGEKTSISGYLEFLPDDSITVWGKTTDGITIAATKIRNNSTRKIKGKYLATIADIAPADINFGNGIQGEFAAVRGADQLVITLAFGYTKVKDAKNHRILYTDLQTGDVVQLQGITRTFTFFGPTPITEVYNTKEIKVKSHGAVPDFPLAPNFFKVNR